MMQHLQFMSAAQQTLDGSFCYKPERLPEPLPETLPEVTMACPNQAEASRQGVGVHLLLQWKHSGRDAWSEELLWMSSSSYVWLIHVQGLPTKRFLVLLDVFIQTLVRVSGRMYRDYDLAIVHIIDTLQTEGTKRASERLRHDILEGVFLLHDPSHVSNMDMKWEDFLLLRAQFIEATREMYHSIKYGSNAPRFHPSSWREEVMMYLHRPHGFLYEATRDHALSLGLGISL